MMSSFGKTIRPYLRILKPQFTSRIPVTTVRAARAAFPRGDRYLTLRDELGTVFDDAMFAHLFPKVGQPAEAPWRLALVIIVQQIEGLSDRDMTDATLSNSQKFVSALLTTA